MGLVITKQSAYHTFALKRRSYANSDTFTILGTLSGSICAFIKAAAAVAAAATVDATVTGVVLPPAEASNSSKLGIKPRGAIAPATSIESKV